VARRLAGSSGWLMVTKLTLGPISTSSPIVMPPRSMNSQAWLTNTLRPTRMFLPKSV